MAAKDDVQAPAAPPTRFGRATRAWFGQTFPGPTEVQRSGWPVIASGQHVLLLAPTGSGKTLAAFLWCIDQLTRMPARELGRGVRVVYVSPLKALAYDVQRNLRGPLEGIVEAGRSGDVAVAEPRVSMRSGDTPQRDRRRQARHPPDILVTTPESLYLMLGSQVRETLRTVHTVIVDEVHSLAPTKRGAHLAVSLERLAALAAQDPQRIALSATARPIDLVAGFVGGDRQVAVVDATSPPRLDLEILVPVPDMTRPDLRRVGAPEVGATKPRAESIAGRADVRRGADESQPAKQGRGIWGAVVPELVRLVRRHRTTIVFVNNRARCERLVREINERCGEELVEPHHGSLSQSQRARVEQALKEGRIRGIVATSSLELGIDMGAVDLVVLVESPGSVSTGLQRVGRAGHAVGQVSKGRLFPKHRGDLLEASVVALRMRQGAIESLRVPHNPLDVLAQHLVAMCAVEPWPVAEAERIVRRAYGFRGLPASAFVAVLDMLSGKYPSSAFADLRPRLVWDRSRDLLSARRGARTLAAVSGGTIPDRGLYGVVLGEQGPRVGELDEEMVHETQPGNVITLGASSWRVEQIHRDRVVVSPAPGEVGRMPFWRGDGPGRPIELGRALGAFLRQLDGDADDATRRARLCDECRLADWAADNLLAYLRDQREATGTLPTDRAVTVERFRDELGDWRICILSPFGARVHAPWALAVQARLAREAGFDIQAMWSDDGLVVRLPDTGDTVPTSWLLPDPEEVEALVVAQLGHSALFAARFRENAARALLLPRRRPGARTPLWQQRLRAQSLLAVAREHPSFPIVVETYRECLQDVFDLPALVEQLRAIHRREVRVDEVRTAAASPFARSLVFAYVATYLYEGDAPLAERRAQALTLDRQLLRELLGQQELRELLDEAALSVVEQELQHLAEHRRARDADELHDVLRRLGALTEAEVAARSTAPPAPWLEALRAAQRVARLQVGDRPMLVAVEDAALYRDGLAAELPKAIPEAFLGATDRPLEQLIHRLARTRGPFTAVELAARYGLAADAVELVLQELERRGRIVEGGFRPGGRGAEWCDVEVLRRIKRLTLARLRGEVEPVEAAVFARFMPVWHGVGPLGRGELALEEAIRRLEGLPLSFAALEQELLPARVADFRPTMLDELGTLGKIVWVGCGALGAQDGRVMVLRRCSVARLLEPAPVPENLSPAARRLLEGVERLGASFFADLVAVVPRDARSAGPSHEELIDALWELVWAGLLTNDTLQPLRALGLRGSRRRLRRSGSDLRVAGRWSLVRTLAAPEGSATERAYARALMLLERHGIVGRKAGVIEQLPGGFQGLYPALRALEESGRVRRGYFVDGLGGAQFALPGAVDRLRRLRVSPLRRQVVVLSATDPANPFGWVLPWPVRAAGDAHEPRRAVGALVVLVDGAPVFYLERGGHRLLSFGDPGPDTEVRALAGLCDLLARHRGSSARIDYVDGRRATSSPLAAAMRQAGMSWDHRGFYVERDP